MSDPRVLQPSDALLREALTREPDAAARDAVLRELAASVAAKPRRPRAWADAVLPGWRRQATLVAFLAIAALLALLALAIVGARLAPLPAGIGANGLIAYDNGFIHIANPDRSDDRRLTSGATVELAPVFAADGTALAFWSSQSSIGPTIPRTLRVVDLETPSPQPRSLATVSGASSWRIAWSPDGSRLAFADVVNGRRQIDVIRRDATGLQQLGPRDLDGWDPAWSPAGDRIAFQGGRSEADRGLYVMNADGSNVHRISTVPSRGRGYLIPDWSAVSDRIAVAVEAGGDDPFQRDIWVLSPDGTSQVDISNDARDEYAPAWSPDGTHIAYLRASTGDPSSVRVIVADGNGGEAREVGPIQNDGSVMWSPDGRLVLVRAGPGQGAAPWQVDTIDLATGAETQIGASGDVNGDPVWQWRKP